MTVNRVASAVCLIALILLPAAGGLAQDAGADAAAQAVQQATQISVQAAQQAQEQMQLSAQLAAQQAQQAMLNASTPGPPPGRPGLPLTDKPHLYPRSGKYAAGTSVTIQDSIPKAAIFYTTDGSLPTTSSKVYSGPIVLASSVRLRAIAKSPIYSASGVATAKYVIQ